MQYHHYSFVREKFVQNMVRVIEYVREKVVVHVSNAMTARTCR